MSWVEINGVPYLPDGELERKANSVARKEGYGLATKIIFLAGVTEPRVTSHTRYGYRKKATDQYVPKAYVSKGWSSVYYQPAKTTVAFPLEMMPDWLKEKVEKHEGEVR